MKIRNGFVSNSSSSSFIITMDKNKDNKIKATIEIDMKDYGQIVKTIEGLDNYFINYYGKNWKTEFKDETYIMKKYNKVLKAIQEGKKVIFGMVTSDSDDPIELYLKNTGLPKSIKKNGIEIIEDID